MLYIEPTEIFGSKNYTSPVPLNNKFEYIIITNGETKKKHYGLN